MSSETFYVEKISHCQIWGRDYLASGIYYLQNRMYHIFDSTRAGGAYRIPAPVVNGPIYGLSEAEKACLTTWLIDQRAQGESAPNVSSEVVEHIKNARPLPAHERADRLLKFIADQSVEVGRMVDISGDLYHSACAYSESINTGEVIYFAGYIDKKGWIMHPHFIGSSFSATVTVEGYSRIAEQAVNAKSAQAFVAMWFDDSMADAYEKGISLAITDVGYVPLRIDAKEHINKIEDEIIAEIRRSRFIVADFTQGADGARGGVYYEAGFAHGLDLRVIFTCRNDSVGNLHFDTSHYNHIVWRDPDDLRKKLKDRILAVLGEGPQIRRGV